MNLYHLVAVVSRIEKAAGLGYADIRGKEIVFTLHRANQTAPELKPGDKIYFGQLQSVILDWKTQAEMENPKLAAKPPKKSKRPLLKVGRTFPPALTHATHNEWQAPPNTLLSRRYYK